MKRFLPFTKGRNSNHCKADVCIPVGFRVCAPRLPTGIGLCNTWSSHPIRSLNRHPVPLASALPLASFSFCTTKAILAVRVTLPPVGYAKDFEELSSSPSSRCALQGAQKKQWEKLNALPIVTKNQPILIRTTTGSRALSESPR